jgi:hypothetical protein
MRLFYQRIDPSEIATLNLSQCAEINYSLD